jgi:hypothetical protein
MALLSSVGAKSVRPAAGKFRVIQADQSEAGVLTPGVAVPVKVLAGKVVLQFVPPGDDPLLRDFTITLTVKEPYELAGNLYQYSGEAHQSAGNALMAVRAFARVLEEKPYPQSEQALRSGLPEVIRGLYRTWVDQAVAKGRTLGGDLAARLDDAKKKPAEEAILLLLEIYAAKDSSPPLRGAAAAGLATLLARQKQAYEAIEWAERLAKEKFDPGAEAVGLLSSIAKTLPGLQERWEPVARDIEDARKASQAKVDPPPPPPPPNPAPVSSARVGVLQVTKFGTFLKLDPEMQVAVGDILEVYRDGERVGDVRVISTQGPDPQYPHGSAEVKKGTGTPQKLDEVRRRK